MQSKNDSSDDSSSKQLAHSISALDMLCLFLAPIAGGAGNYMTLFFSSCLHWGTNKIGVLLAALSISLAIAQVPAGVLIDKKLKLKQHTILALVVIALAWLSVVIYPDFSLALVAQIITGCMCAIFMPAVASITLGIVGLKKFDMRLGRNGVFSHAGNCLTAIFVAVCIGLLGSWSVPLLLIIFGACAVVATGQINNDCINYDILRRWTATHERVHPLLSGFATLFKGKTSRLFTVAALLYTFADASMLPLMVQRIAALDSKSSTIHIPVALFLTELVMIPVCYIAGKRAHLGRKPLLVISYIFLFIRGLCFSLSKDPNLLVGLQILDGISAGMFSLMLTLVISDLSSDTGSFNATLTSMGMLFTLTNGLSNLLFGFTTGKFGYPMSFSVMAISAMIGGLLIWILVPETVKRNHENHIAPVVT